MTIEPPENSGFEPGDVQGGDVAANATVAEKAEKPPLLRRTGVQLGIVAVALTLVSGGIGYALGDAGDSAPASSAVPHHHHGHHHPHKHGQAKAEVGARHGVVGTITAVNGDTWTVKRPGGTTATVTITPKTAFGTAAAPKPRSEYAVGDQVFIHGTVAGNTVTAVRVLDKQDLPKPPAKTGGG